MDTTDTEDEDLPQISLQEMPDDFHIADDPMGDADLITCTSRRPIDLLTYLEIYDVVTDEIFIPNRFTYYEPDLHHLLTVTDF